MHVCAAWLWCIPLHTQGTMTETDVTSGGLKQPKIHDLVIILVISDIRGLALLKKGPESKKHDHKLCLHGLIQCTTLKEPSLPPRSFSFFFRFFVSSFSDFIRLLLSCASALMLVAADLCGRAVDASWSDVFIPQFLTPPWLPAKSSNSGGWPWVGIQCPFLGFEWT